MAEISEDLSKLIYKYAIKNAHDYGKASGSPVMNKIISLKPEFKSKMKDLGKEVAAAVDMVNMMSGEEVEREYNKYRGEFEEEQKAKVEKGKVKFSLSGAVEGDFATRFAPEPSGYMHVGHASAAFLAQEFSRIYKGKDFLYFDDTNPEKEKQEYVDAFKADLEWLGIKYDKEYYASDNIEKIYGYARQLMNDRKAYVCTCSAEKIRKNRFDGNGCEHRENDAQKNLSLFDKMLSGGFNEGEAVVRFLANMMSQNTALRDPTILRIKKTGHYRQKDKYVVWPNYDFNTPINDSINGVTDAMRTKEYELRGALYDMILEALGIRIPRVHLHARISIKGQPRQKREIRKLLKDGSVDGWDDPRLVTIAALRKRGIRPEAIREFVLSFGMSMVGSVVDIGALLADNKRIIDPVSKRLYYVERPVKVVLSNQNKKEVELPLHPSAKLGSRRVRVGNFVYISMDDATAIKEGEPLRLKGFSVIKPVMIDLGKKEITAEVVDVEKADKAIQWVSDSCMLSTFVEIPGKLLDENGELAKNSLAISKGFVEDYAKDLKDGETVQFERFGFCTCHFKDGAPYFIYLSK